MIVIRLIMMVKVDDDVISYKLYRVESYLVMKVIIVKEVITCDVLPAGMIFVKKNYATTVLEARILRKKRVNRNISQFATKRELIL